MAADVLEIKLGVLEVEKSLQLAPKSSNKVLMRDMSPMPYNQNDNGNDSDEVVEITPEIYHDNDDDDDDENSDGAYAPHFLMQVIILKYHFVHPWYNHTLLHYQATASILK